jgi:hypothetical protein
VQPQSSSGVGINIESIEPVTKPSLPESSTGVDSNVMKDQPSSVPNPPQSSTIVTEKSSNIQEAQLPSKRKHPQISVVVMKLPKARFVGADGKLSLARGIPIPLPDHVVSIKPTSADPAPSVVSECPSAHVQPSAHAPSIDPNSGAPSGTRPVAARVAARPAMADPGDLFHEFEPEEAARLSLDASQPTG